MNFARVNFIYTRAIPNFQGEKKKKKKKKKNKIGYIKKKKKN